MRKDLPALFDDRGADCDPGALPGAGPDFKHAANQVDSLTHTDEAQTRRKPRSLNIEANPGILYFQEPLFPGASPPWHLVVHTQAG